jgi:hypothetical protein
MVSVQPLYVKPLELEIQQMMVPDYISLAASPVIYLKKFEERFKEDSKQRT